MWMLCSRSANNKINKLHERALRIVYYDYNSKFEEFLTKDGSFTIHHQIIQTLATEMFKVHNGFHKSLLKISFIIIMKITFIVYDLNPTFKELTLLLIGVESVRYIGPVIWNNSSIETKSIKNFDIFKTEVRKWKPTNCSSRLCKIYVKEKT